MIVLFLEERKWKCSLERKQTACDQLGQCGSVYPAPDDNTWYLSASFGVLIKNWPADKAATFMNIIHIGKKVDVIDAREYQLQLVKRSHHWYNPSPSASLYSTKRYAPSHWSGYSSQSSSSIYHLAASCWLLVCKNFLPRSLREDLLYQIVCF